MTTPREPPQDKGPADTPTRPHFSEPTGDALAPGVPAVHEFHTLSNGAHCVLIRLGNEVYTLRRTSSGKLILNK